MSREPRASLKTSRNRIQRHLERHRENCRRDVAANHFRVSPPSGEHRRPHRRPRQACPAQRLKAREPTSRLLGRCPPSPPLGRRGPHTRILLMNARLAEARLQGCAAGSIGEPSRGHMRISRAAQSQHSRQASARALRQVETHRVREFLFIGEYSACLFTGRPSPSYHTCSLPWHHRDRRCDGWGHQRTIPLSPSSPQGGREKWSTAAY